MKSSMPFLSQALMSPPKASFLVSALHRFHIRFALRAVSLTGAPPPHAFSDSESGIAIAGRFCRAYRRADDDAYPRIAICSLSSTIAFFLYAASPTPPASRPRAAEISYAMFSGAY
jgi:hypothetical protein